jgi:hypothetical protein
MAYRDLRPIWALTLVGLFANVFGASVEPTPSDLDAKAAEQHFVQWAARPSLHSQDTLPDGAKGLSTAQPTRGSLAASVVQDPKYKGAADFYAHGLYCGSDAIVLGKFVDSTPVLSSRKNVVYTYSHFEVLQIIKGDDLLRSGQTIVTYRLGGEVTDDGEKLRIEVTDAPAYRAGREYILDLRKEKGARTPQYSAEDHATISVHDQRVYSSRGTYAGMPDGTTFSEVVGELSNIKKLGCPP